LIEAVSVGDLSRRMELTGKDGLHRTMSQGMNRLVETIDAVIRDLTRVLGAQAQGDLSGRIDKTYRGSFQTVAQDINATTAKLAEMVGNVASATRTISDAAAQVAAGSCDLSERTEQQAAALEETAASLEQLGATARTNAETSRQANKMVGDARSAAERGNVVANSAIDAMTQISEASRKITEIIGVIDEIAFQTNLLALNAAVEAARAGDAGKGFAVVAQEVRILAQRSAQASKEIKALILNSDSQVHNGVDQVRKAGESLTGIVTAVQHVAGLIGELAGASQEQAAAVQQINSTVSQLDEMTQKNAALVEETTAAAQAMAEETGALRRLMAFFEGAPNVSVSHPPRRSR
jgi:methyl-accepting chemotaxis protein